VSTVGAKEELIWRYIEIQGKGDTGQKSTIGLNETILQAQDWGGSFLCLAGATIELPGSDEFPNNLLVN
jgi:hypothetical protein